MLPAHVTPIIEEERQDWRKLYLREQFDISVVGLEQYISLDKYFDIPNSSYDLVQETTR